MHSSLDKFYLKAKTKVAKLDEALIAKIAYSSLKAMEFLASKKIMLRDIKPSNILINRDGKIKLCGFGLSDLINNTVCLTITGCCPYMAVCSFFLSFTLNIILFFMNSQK
jgi:serine/threonine protein kinase